ncbi:hypothetical protein R7236_25400 [Priestia megaterium]|uniref:hypothetical protein n=1 Tax=Priestia megaterium TaxID=1404 RepID=UPI000BEC5979|nr:hypothetical protein [Priestia megaterium]MDW4511682.1 hypothetical protein [Priestia megaterium]MDW4511731.1 hypothetical protein [Priestia megaterium]PEC42091.1 hypothetical protein CON11_25040 [Priestia megaterium]
MVYRTTLRCSDIYRTYLDKLFQSTSLDRTQIIRCALFTAPSNPQFLDLMQQFQYRHQDDIAPPSFDLWHFSDHYLWLEQDPIIKERERLQDDVSQRKDSSPINAKYFGSPRNSESLSIKKETDQQYRRQQSITGSSRQVSSIRSSNGGIKLDLR